MKCKLVRSRAQWVDEGEKPTKYFCGLESKNYTSFKEPITKTFRSFQKNFKNSDPGLLLFFIFFKISPASKTGFIAGRYIGENN
jgi:hypothetical protein